MIRINAVDPMMITWIVIVAIIGCLFLAFCIVFLSKKIKSKKSNTLKNQDKKLTVSDDEFFRLIGGKENIIKYKLVGSRLTLELKDNSKVDKEGLKKEKFDGIIEMKNKIVLVKEDLSTELKALDDLKLN